MRSNVGTGCQNFSMKDTNYVETLVRKAVRDAALVRPDWTAGAWRDPKLLWLDKNENTDPILAQVTSRVLAGILSATLQTYPECAPLYRKLAARLGLEINSLLLAHGSDGVIRTVFETFIEPGDGVLFPSPTFAMYTVYSRIYGAKAIPLEYQPSEGGPSLSAARVSEEIARSKPKLVCLPNPDSPTGTVFSPAELREIIVAAQENAAVILVDEAYFPFYDQTVIGLTREFPHLIVARTFAKAWGVAGLRIGYAVSHPLVTPFLHKVRPMYEVNTLAVAALEQLLDFEDEMLASVRRLNAGKEYFLDEMGKMNLRTLRGHGNFLHVAFGPHAPSVHDALKGMVLYRRDFAEPSLKSFSRFSATTQELFQPIIDTIRVKVT